MRTEPHKIAIPRNAESAAHWRAHATRAWEEFLRRLGEQPGVEIVTATTVSPPTTVFG